MNVEDFVSMLNEVSYIDYTNHQASSIELEEFATKFNLVFDQPVDPSLLSLFSNVNGFDENGLTFYGTNKSDKKYVLDFYEQNEFWRLEVVGLIPYMVIADGDMDFYARELLSGDYCVLGKWGLTLVCRFATFEELLDEIVKSYF